MRLIRQSAHDTRIRMFLEGFPLSIPGPVPVVSMDHAGQVVRSATGRVNYPTTLGQVDRLIVAPEDGRITHVVASKGLLRDDYPMITVGLVEEVAEESVLIRLTSNEVKALPRYQK